MSPAWKPGGYTSLSPYLITENAEAVLDFLGNALGAEALRRFDNPDGSVLHAEVRIDDTVLMLGQAGEGWPPVPCHVHVYVPDLDRTWELALEHGAEVVEEPSRREGDPDRRGGVKGPGGNTWWLATQVDG